MIKQYGGEQGNNAYILSKVPISKTNIPDDSSREKFCKDLVAFAQGKLRSIFVCFKDSYVYDANSFNPQKLLEVLKEKPHDLVNVSKRTGEPRFERKNKDMSGSFSRWISEFVKDKDVAPVAPVQMGEKMDTKLTKKT